MSLSFVRVVIFSWSILNRAYAIRKSSCSFSNFSVSSDCSLANSLFFWVNYSSEWLRRSYSFLCSNYELLEAYMHKLSKPRCISLLFSFSTITSLFLNPISFVWLVNSVFMSFNPSINSYGFLNWFILMLVSTFSDKGFRMALI